jgi:hypothetical protein|tara:strand:+ start:13742 stop:14419 length:678 start_codon:yes stop_codon:yes gene_type:complete
MVNEETKHDCNESHPDISHEDWLDQNPEMVELGEDEELDELVDYDGSILSSKVPNNFTKATKVSRSTTDDTDKASHQNPGNFFYKRYWAEAYMGAGLGDNEDTDTLSGEETLEMYTDEDEGYGLSYSKALEKAEEKGKIVKGSKKQLTSDKMRITEKERIKKIVEKLLTNKDNDVTIADKQQELRDGGEIDPIIKRKFKNLIKTIKSTSGLSVDEVIKNLLNNAG